MRQPSNLRNFLIHAVAGGMLIFGFSLANAGDSGDEEATALRILPVARVTLAKASTPGGGLPRSGEAIYATTCAACHATGVAGAPKIGDAVAWAPRIKLGLAGLVKSATAGKNAMPPKGGSDASELELARAIVFMANKSGAKLAEPK
jgi:cytochrome c5